MIKKILCLAFTLSIAGNIAYGQSSSDAILNCKSMMEKVIAIYHSQVTSVDVPLKESRNLSFEFGDSGFIGMGGEFVMEDNTEYLAAADRLGVSCILTNIEELQ